MYGIESFDLVSPCSSFLRLLPLDVLFWYHPAFDFIENRHQLAGCPFNVGHGLL